METGQSLELPEVLWPAVGTKILTNGNTRYVNYIHVVQKRCPSTEYLLWLTVRVLKFRVSAGQCHVV